MYYIYSYGFPKYFLFGVFLNKSFSNDDLMRSQQRFIVLFRNCNPDSLDTKSIKPKCSCSCTLLCPCVCSCILLYLPVCFCVLLYAPVCSCLFAKTFRIIDSLDFKIEKDVCIQNYTHSFVMYFLYLLIGTLLC